MEEEAAAAKDTSALPSADAALSSAFQRFLAGSAAAGDELKAGVAARQAAAARFEAISHEVAGVATAALAPHDGEFDHECHYATYLAYKGSCGEWDEHALVHSATLAKLCKVTSGASATIVSAIRGGCQV